MSTLNALIQSSRTKREQAVKPVHKDPHFSVSGINRFMNCRRAAYYWVIRCITLKRPRFSLENGTIWHNALDVLYSFNSVPAAIKAIEKGFADLKITIPTNTAYQINEFEAMLKGMIKGYAAQYLKSDLKTWNFLKTEKEFRIKNFLGTGLDFVGRFDAIVYIPKGPLKGIWILESKTTSDLTYYETSSIRMSTQFLGYCYAAKEVTGKKPRGVIWNAIKKPGIRLKKNQTPEAYCKELEEDIPARPEFYFFREHILVTDAAIEMWQREINQVALDLQLCMENPGMPDLWYRNPQRCKDFGGCEYYPLCTRGEKRSTLILFKTIEKE